MSKMAEKLWRITLNMTPREKEEFEFYKSKNRLTGSNAKVLKKLALSAMNKSVNDDTKRVLITDASANKLRALLIENTNVLNDILAHYKHLNGAADDKDDMVIRAIQGAQKAVTDRWQSLL